MRRALIVVLGLLVATATACADPNALSSEQQELAAYLSSMYRTQGDVLAATALLMPSSDDLEAASQDELVAQQQEIAGQIDALLEQYVADLAAITPPTSASDFHAALITSTQQIAAETKGILDDLASDDIDVVLQAQQDQAALLQDVTADNQGLQEDLAGMVTQVLAHRDDPESVYILELLELRTASGVEAAQELLGELDAAPTSPEEVTDLIDQVVGVFAAVRADYSAVTPPETWADLHGDQIAFLDDGIALYSRFGEVLTPIFDDPESVDLDELGQLFQDLLDWAARGPELNAAFSDRLADYFEELT